MTIASDIGKPDTPPVADLLPRLADTYTILVENLERMPARYLARGDAKGLHGGV